LLKLPPLLPVTHARLGQSLSEQVRALGATGFPMVVFRGDQLDAETQWLELSTALAASSGNGGWPFLLVDASADLLERVAQAGTPGGWKGLLPVEVATIPCGATLSIVRSHYEAGAESLAVAETLAGSSRGMEFLWQAQLLRWQMRPLFRQGQGIALVGGSGCGKSTLARELGAFLGMPVKDLDSVVAERARKPIHRIFAEDGEPFFRRLESAVTCEAFEAPAVLALGGGAWETEATRASAREHGYVVLWVAEEPSRVWNRIAHDPERPLAQEQQVFISRWRARMPRWMEEAMLLPLGRSATELAAALAGTKGKE
jgi:shikimate kinase